MSDGLPPAPCEITVDARGDELWIMPVGDVDLLAAPDIRDAIDLGLRSDARLVIVDLRGVDLLDSTGLRVLLTAMNGAEGERVRFVEGGRGVQGVLRVAGLEGRLPLHPAS